MALVEEDADKLREEVMALLKTTSDGRWSFQNDTLQRKDDKLRVFFSNNLGDQGRFEDVILEGRSKRRKIRHDEDRMDIDSEPSRATKLISRVYKALGSQESDDLGGLSTVAQYE